MVQYLLQRIIEDPKERKMRKSIPTGRACSDDCWCACWPWNLIKSLLLLQQEHTQHLSGLDRWRAPLELQNVWIEDPKSVIHGPKSRRDFEIRSPYPRIEFMEGKIYTSDMLALSTTTLPTKASEWFMLLASGKSAFFCVWPHLTCCGGKK